MPLMQAFVERLNARFNSTNINNVDEALLQPGSNVGDAAMGSRQGAGAIGASQGERDYVMRNFSQGDLDALRDILYWAVTQNPRVPVQFLWVPGDGFRIESWNVAGMEATATAPASRGGISVLLHGPTEAQIIQ